jgi:hypothetical protein
VVDATGMTLCDPLGETVPRTSMLMSVAFVVCQVKVEDPPWTTVVGLAEIEAVGAAGGGVLDGGELCGGAEDGAPPPQPNIKRVKTRRSNTAAKRFAKNISSLSGSQSVQAGHRSHARAEGGNPTGELYAFFAES